MAILFEYDGGLQLVRCVEMLFEKIINHILPRFNLGNAFTERTEFFDFIRGSIYEVLAGNTFVQALMHLETIVDEVRNPNLFTDRSLVFSFLAEPDVVSKEAGSIVEAVVFKPSQSSSDGLITLHF